MYWPTIWNSGLFFFYYLLSSWYKGVWYYPWLRLDLSTQPGHTEFSYKRINSAHRWGHGTYSLRYYSTQQSLFGGLLSHGQAHIAPTNWSSIADIPCARCYSPSTHSITSCSLFSLSWFFRHICWTKTATSSEGLWSFHSIDTGLQTSQYSTVSTSTS